MFNVGIKGVIFLGEYVSRSDKKSGQDWNKIKNYALQIKKLASEFKIHLTLSEFFDENKRIDILITFLVPYLRNIGKSTDMDSFESSSTNKRKRKRVEGQSPVKRLQSRGLSLPNLYYLSDILQLSRHTFQIQAAIQASKLGFPSISISYLQELTQNTVSSFILSAIKEVSLNLIKNSSENNVPNLLMPLIQWALSKCPPEQIQEFLNLASDVERIGWIYQQTESEDKENSFFNEEQMFLDAKEVIPLAKNYVISRADGQETNTKKLFDVLHRNGCLVLATNLLIESPTLLKDQSLEEIASNLLNKILSSRDIDYSLALGITLSMGHDKSFQYLNKSLPQRNGEYSKTQIICQIGQDSSIL